MVKFFKKSRRVIVVILMCSVLVGFSAVKNGVSMHNNLPYILEEANQLVEIYMYDEALAYLEESGISNEKTELLKQEIQLKKN